MKTHALFSLLGISITLVACGGGGSGGEVQGTTTVSTEVVADAIDKYVGTWSACVPWSTNYPTKVTETITKTSATTANYEHVELLFSDPACSSGTGAPNWHERGTLSFKGTKTVGANIVDKSESTVTFDAESTTTEPRVEKDLYLIYENKLYVGDRDSQLDADGYPSAMEPKLALVKQ